MVPALFAVKFVGTFVLLLLNHSMAYYVLLIMIGEAAPSVYHDRKGGSFCWPKVNVSKPIDSLSDIRNRAFIPTIDLATK